MDDLTKNTKIKSKKRLKQDLNLRSETEYDETSSSHTP